MDKDSIKLTLIKALRMRSLVDTWVKTNKTFVARPAASNEQRRALISQCPPLRSLIDIQLFVDACNMCTRLISVTVVERFARPVSLPVLPDCSHNSYACTALSQSTRIHQVCMLALATPRPIIAEFLSPILTSALTQWTSILQCP